jgi:hypothetical protein
MDFLGKKGPKSSDFKDFFLKLPDLDKRFQHVKIYENSFIFLLFSLTLTCSQIWLSPLVDDETTCLTKFGGGGGSRKKLLSRSSDVFPKNSSRWVGHHAQEDL